MKKNISISIMIATLSLVSCDDYLDKRPDLGFTQEVVFNDFNSIRGYFDKVYDLLVDHFFGYSQGMDGHHVLSDMSDETANPYKSRSSMGSILNRGLWYGGNTNSTAEIGWDELRITEGSKNRGKVIPKGFFGIRICNRILEEVPNMTNLTDDQKNQLISQAYFFRGWFYFEIIRRIGGFAFLDKTYNSNDDGNMERLTYAESNDWVIENMNEAIKLLPDKWEDAQTGRPTKSSAYAVKSMAQLYAASPLMRNGLDRTDQFNDYDADRVRLAAEYAKECLEYLERNKGVYDQTLMPKEEYANIFYYRNGQFTSRESLWYLNNGGVNRENEMTWFWQNVEMANRPGTVGTPNHSLNHTIIDKFETSNGYICKLTSTGWECDDPSFDPEQPYLNRDPRLYHFVLLPGESFGTFRTAAGDDTDRNDYYLATWQGGRDDNLSGNAEGGDGRVLTRYMIKKYQWPASVTGNSGHSGYTEYNYNMVHIRTTQIWLDYAEAMNEAYGPDVKPAGYTYSALEALNIVRERVGHCPVRSIHTGSKEAFREKIRDERAVELLCECHRWFDIRRWMIAEQIFSDPLPIKGAIVQFKQGYTSINTRQLPPGATAVERRNAKYGRCFTYSLLPIVEEVRVFERKHYWYPIRRDEVNRFPALKQNPGW